MGGFTFDFRIDWERSVFRGIGEVGVFRYLVQNARWKRSIVYRYYRGIRVAIGRGQLVMSARDLADKAEWSKDKALRFLRRLEAASLIAIHNEAGVTIITICDFDRYSPLEDGNETAGETPAETALRHSRDTTRITEEEKNKSNRFDSNRGAGAHRNQDGDQHILHLDQSPEAEQGDDDRLVSLFRDLRNLHFAEEAWRKTSPDVVLVAQARTILATLPIERAGKVLRNRMEADAASARRLGTLGESIPAGLAKYSRSFEAAARQEAEEPSGVVGPVGEGAPRSSEPVRRDPPTGWAEMVAELRQDPILAPWVSTISLVDVVEGKARLASGTSLAIRKLSARRDLVRESAARHLGATAIELVESAALAAGGYRGGDQA